MVSSLDSKIRRNSTAIIGWPRSTVGLWNCTSLLISLNFLNIFTIRRIFRPWRYAELSSSQLIQAVAKNSSLTLKHMLKFLIFSLNTIKLWARNFKLRMSIFFSTKFSASCIKIIWLLSKLKEWCPMSKAVNRMLTSLMKKTRKKIFKLRKKRRS
jgi:hypothetical protein